MSAWPPPPLHYNPPDKPRKPREKEIDWYGVVCVSLGFLLGCGVTYLLMTLVASHGV